VRNVCDRVAVMYAGELVERGETESVLAEPQHPYTEALAAAVPTPDPRAESVAATLSGDVPDPADPPAGCRFHPRCPSVIPPADTDVTSETYAAIVGFRTALGTGELTREQLTELAAARHGIDTEAVTDDRRRETVRAEYDLPDEFGDDTVADTVAEAVSLVTDGEDEAAHTLLSESFTSVCERENPEFYDTEAGQLAACHLHDE
ncbi:MAG: oligopeptide/dipeptide ABC transporter ATP-binding protein, partial [Halobaculum sp.]